MASWDSADESCSSLTKNSKNQKHLSVLIFSDNDNVLAGQTYCPAQGYWQTKMEHWWNDDCQVKNESSCKRTCPSTTVFVTKCTWISWGLNNDGANKNTAALLNVNTWNIATPCSNYRICHGLLKVTELMMKFFNIHRHQPFDPAH